MSFECGLARPYLAAGALVLLIDVADFPNELGHPEGDFIENVLDGSVVIVEGLRRVEPVEDAVSISLVLRRCRLQLLLGYGSIPWEVAFANLHGVAVLPTSLAVLAGQLVGAETAGFPSVHHLFTDVSEQPDIKR